MTTLNSSELSAIKNAVESKLIGRFGNKTHECIIIEGLVDSISEALSRARSVTEGETELGASVVPTVGSAAKRAAQKLHDENLIEFSHMKDEAEEIIQSAIDETLPSRIPSGELGELLKEVERLDQAATKGPWVRDDNAYPPERAVCDRDIVIVATATNANSRDPDAQLRQQLNNLAFIAFVRTALPRLARELAYQIELRGGIESERDKAESDRNAYREAMDKAHAELSTLRDSCEAQRVEIEGLKNLLNEQPS